MIRKSEYYNAVNYNSVSFSPTFDIDVMANELIDLSSESDSDEELDELVFYIL